MMRIEIKGTIIPNGLQEAYDFFNVDATSPKKVKSAIESLKEDEEAVFEINSGGGEIFAGSEIYSMIRSLKNKEIEITGLAGSAASVIAMAGHSKMSPTAMIMIHNVSTCAQGDWQVFDHESKVLRECNRSIAAAYVEKTGKPEAELLDLMNEETWMSSTKALELGFVDEIMTACDGVYNSMCRILTAEEIEQARAALKIQNQLEQERLNLLKLEV
jgi:ATP-dependent Clp protease protease subunit